MVQLLVCWGGFAVFRAVARECLVFTRVTRLVSWRNCCLVADRLSVEVNALGLRPPLANDPNPIRRRLRRPALHGVRRGRARGARQPQTAIRVSCVAVRRRRVGRLRRVVSAPVVPFAGSVWPGVGRRERSRRPVLSSDMDMALTRWLSVWNIVREPGHRSRLGCSNDRDDAIQHVFETVGGMLVLSRNGGGDRPAAAQRLVAGRRGTCDADGHRDPHAMGRGSRGRLRGGGGRRSD